MDEITIKVWKSEEGFMYGIYDGDGDEAEEIDGGLCTTSMSNAIGMACEQAEALALSSEAKCAHVWEPMAGEEEEEAPYEQCNMCGTVKP